MHLVQILLLTVWSFTIAFVLAFDSIMLSSAAAVVLQHCQRL
jgi:hypothetical protein